MKSYNILILYILFIEIFAHNNTKDHTNHSSELKTFIVKTKLTKEELEELLAKSETAFLYLRQKENKNQTLNSEKNNNNTVEIPPENLEKQIEEQIKKEALNPLKDFHVKEMKDSNITKAFISKEEKVIIDSFYEEKYGRIYGFLILFSIIFAIFYFREFLFKKKEIMKKNPYSNLFESDTNEYMLVKTE